MTTEINNGYLKASQISLFTHTYKYRIDEGINHLKLLVRLDPKKLIGHKDSSEIKLEYLLSSEK